MSRHLVGALVQLLIRRSFVAEADRFGVGKARRLCAEEIDDSSVRRIGRFRGVVLDDQCLMIVIAENGGVRLSVAEGRI
jgi:archaeosine-15-forming tRNA-guanine transglycosylase